MRRVSHFVVYLVRNHIRRTILHTFRLTHLSLLCSIRNTVILERLCLGVNDHRLATGTVNCLLLVRVVARSLVLAGE
jgi:hypothetical protein